MRVLYVTGEFPPMQGGVGDCTNEIALALSKRGVEVSVLTSEPPMVGVGRQSSVVSRQKSPLNVMRTVKKWDRSALAQMRNAIVQTGADVVHIQYQTGAFGMNPMINFAPRLLGLSSAGKKAVSVVTFHDLRPMYLFPKAGPLRDWVTFQLAKTTDVVVATNEEDYVRLQGQGIRDLSLIPIGSNINPNLPADFDRAALREELGLEPDEILLCYFGFLNESKGGETLIRALSEMTNARLVMLGGQTGESDVTNIAYLDKVRKLIEGLDLTDRVIWTDFLEPDEVSAHFLASDVCVLPYRDGASYRRGTFMAALAHGMAIVTTADERRMTDDERPFMLQSRHPTNDQRLPILRDGENVVLVPPEDARAIVGAVKRIMASPELGERLRRGARETAQFFTWDKIADAHLSLYQRLLAR